MLLTELEQIEYLGDPDTSAGVTHQRILARFAAGAAIRERRGVLFAVIPHLTRFVVKRDSRDRMMRAVPSNIDYAYTEVEHRAPFLELTALGDPRVPYRASVYPFGGKLCASDLHGPTEGARLQLFRRVLDLHTRNAELRRKGDLIGVFTLGVIP